MKAKPKIRNQEHLFKSRLDQILNNKHPMFVLADQIDWSFFESIIRNEVTIISCIVFMPLK